MSQETSYYARAELFIKGKSSQGEVFSERYIGRIIDCLIRFDKDYFNGEIYDALIYHFDNTPPNQMTCNDIIHFYQEMVPKYKDGVFERCVIVVNGDIVVTMLPPNSSTDINSVQTVTVDKLC